MKLVKARPKYRCDFCSRTSTLEAMERHEIICWKNPDRYCELCDNTGEIDIDEAGTTPCYYCSQRSKDSNQKGER